jgi:[ribosomal protein S5]-alanine N-acetyltransferase
MDGRLHTERLLLRPLLPDDAEPLERLAGDRAIADTMISVPHPFTRRDALDWITAYGDAAPGPHRYFATCLSGAGELVGITALRDIDEEHAQAELSFWIGRAHWGRGLASEAAGAALQYAFEVLGLNRVTAFHMLRNPASGRVLGRLGFRQEGVLRQRVRKWGVFEDVAAYAVLREEYCGARRW